MALLIILLTASLTVEILKWPIATYVLTLPFILEDCPTDDKNPKVQAGSCPLKKTLVSKLPGNSMKSYKWEECGNLCYMAGNCTGWRWFDSSKDEEAGDCFLLSGELTEEDLQEGIVSGYSDCPGNNIFFQIIFISNSLQLKIVHSTIMRDGGI